VQRDQSPLRSVAGVALGVTLVPGGIAGEGLLGNGGSPSPRCTGVSTKRKLSPWLMGRVCHRERCSVAARGNVLELRHADSAALDRLGPLLTELRKIPGLKEVRTGIFYRRSRAFIHFHDDPSGLYADVRLERDFERYRVETDEERLYLLKQIRTVLSP
jgi:hypothetical protein